MKTISYQLTNNETIHASFWKANSNESHPTIFYIHGGGLIYGNRNDLPQAYIDKFLKNGFSVFSIDYYLAPESSYNKIITSVRDGLNYFLTNYQELSLFNNNYILFGRSAGAYLCMQLLASNLSKAPVAFLDFYGFESLMANNLKKDCQFYNNYPKITKEEVQSLFSKSPLTSSSVEDRFLIYVFARQNKEWQNMIFKDKNCSEKKLTDKILQAFPPTYICQSTNDPDVPFINSILLKAKLLQVKLITISEKEHDFDRTVSTNNLNIYQNAINWLKELN